MSTLLIPSTLGRRWTTATSQSHVSPCHRRHCSQSAEMSTGRCQPACLDVPQKATEWAPCPCCVGLNSDAGLCTLWEQPLTHNHTPSFAALTESESVLKGGFRVPLNTPQSFLTYLKLYWLFAVPESAALEARIAAMCQQSCPCASPQYVSPAAHNLFLQLPLVSPASLTAKELLPGQNVSRSCLHLLST